MTPWRRTLLALACLLATFGLALAVTGGFVTVLFGSRVSARSPATAAAAAALAATAWFAMAHRDRAARGDLLHLDAWIAARAMRLVSFAAATAGAVAIAYATFSASGADPSGYLSQTFMLQRGALERSEPLAAIADWPGGAGTLAPLGWRAADEAGRQVPTYAIGLPLLMLPLQVVGAALAASLVPALALVVAVWAVGLLAREVAGPRAAVVASTWLATSPVALFEAMQPMSDVPVTAAWLVCWAAAARSTDAPRRVRDRRVMTAGAAAAIAVLIRPNLAPLASLPALWVLSRHGPRPAFFFGAPIAAAGLLVAYLQWRYFGSPWRSGYGTAAEIYAAANVGPNALLYARWLLDTHGPWLFAAPLALLAPAGAGRSILRWTLAFAALVVAAYLVYAVFEVWSYLRFLLPALAMAMVAVATLTARLIAALPPPARGPALLVAVLSLAAVNVASARSLGVFRVADEQSRALLAGRYLASSLGERSVVLAGEQSGSVRYYTGRPIVRWDLMPDAALAAAVNRLSAAGYDVWVALDAWEEEPFRRRFASLPAGALDWPPRVEAGGTLLTRAWRIADRPPFMAGGRAITDRLAPVRR